MKQKGITDMASIDTLDPAVLRDRVVQELRKVTVYGAHDDSLVYWRGMMLGASPMQIMSYLGSLRVDLARAGAAQETQDHVASIACNFCVASDTTAQPWVRDGISMQDAW